MTQLKSRRADKMVDRCKVERDYSAADRLGYMADVAVSMDSIRQKEYAWES